MSRNTETANGMQRRIQERMNRRQQQTILCIDRRKNTGTSRFCQEEKQVQLARKIPKVAEITGAYGINEESFIPFFLSPE